MKPSDINTEHTNLNIALSFHTQEVRHAQREKEKSNSLMIGAEGSENGENMTLAPAVGNMSFQVCGGVQSTLAALQSVVFGNEQKIMNSSTEINKENNLLQGKEGNIGYNATINSGADQAQQAQLSAIQSFTSGAVSAVGVAVQFKGSEMSESSRTLDTLKSKLQDQQTLAAKTTLSSEEQSQLAAVKVGDQSLMKDLPAGQKPNDAIQARVKELCSTGAGSPRTLSDTDLNDYPQGKDFDNTKGGYYLKGFDDAAIETMTPQAKVAANKAIEEQIKTTKTEINTAESKFSQLQQLVQTFTGLANNLVQGGVSQAQCGVIADQKKQEAISAIENQAFGTTTANAQLAAQMKKDAVDAGTQAANAIMAAITTNNRA